MGYVYKSKELLRVNVIKIDEYLTNVKYYINPLLKVTRMLYYYENSCRPVNRIRLTAAYCDH